MSLDSFTHTDGFDGIYSVMNQGFDNALLFYAANPRTAFLILFTFIFSVYYLRKVVKKPELFCSEGKLRWFLLANCTLLQERYWPTFWCFGTHAQTALANCIRGRLPNLNYKRETIALPDGGHCSLDWYDAPRTPSDKCPEDRRPIALFMPGLTGDSQTEYIKSLIPNAHALGYRAVAFNNRGRGGMKLVTPKLYCAANCDDVKIILEHIRTKYPKSKLVATGVSLGGILLCRYLIESGDEALVDAAMLISVCYDLNAGAESMSKTGLNLALNQHLARALASLVQEHSEILKPLKQINFDEVIKSTTLREFDDRFTIKMWGFKSTTEYYTKASLIGRIHCIKRPTLCINAGDDMFSPLDSLPIEEVKQSNHVAIVVTERGGHIGFMEGLLPLLPFYSERLSKQYLLALIKLDDIKKDLI